MKHLYKLEKPKKENQILPKSLFHENLYFLKMPMVKTLKMYIFNSTEPQ